MIVRLALLQHEPETSLASVDPDVFITVVLAALAGAFGIGGALVMHREHRRDRAGTRRVAGERRTGGGGVRSISKKLEA